MDELNEFWKNSIAETVRKMRGEGRHDIAEYLELKAANDEIRGTASRWLFASILEIAHETMQRGINLKIENENPHRFEMNKSSQVGSLLRFSFGVRILTVEAGWTRTPNDGFMRGGALAYARLSHFGKPERNAELILLRSAENAPEWFLINRDGTRKIFDSNILREHFAVFLD